MSIKLREGVFIILAFIAVLYLYAIFVYFGMVDFLKDGVLKDYFRSNVWHVEVILSATLFGTLFILINSLTEGKAFRKKSFGFNLLIRSGLYLIALVAVSIFIFKSFTVFHLVSDQQMQEFQIFLTPRFLFSGLLYYSVFIVLLNFILLVNRKFGPGVLFDLLMGKYFHPRNKSMVFLFLDLRDSTRITEKLGHERYSEFIKECIHELTPILRKYEARVHQYVGDEIVLYWYDLSEKQILKALHTYFGFRVMLEHRQDYFLKKYGEKPHFKAGMDAGQVTVTEVGDIKREIAFHGDVLNTAARLEKKCNQYHADLIVTENVKEYVASSKLFKIKFLSDLPLRGKQEKIRFYGIQK